MYSVFTKMMSKKNKKGFTLVELMVVVVILGILVAIAIPVYSNVTTNAAHKAHDSNVRTLMGAAQMYLANDWDGKTPEDATAMQTALLGKYIQTWPVNPTSSGAYTVTVSATGVAIVLPAIGSY